MRMLGQALIFIALSAPAAAILWIGLDLLTERVTLAVRGGQANDLVAWSIVGLLAFCFLLGVLLILLAARRETAG